MARRRRQTGEPQSAQRRRPRYNLGYNGGLGSIPRRSLDAITARLAEAAEKSPSTAIRAFYRDAPLRLLYLLTIVHPMAKMAHSNNAALAFSPGDTKLVAYTPASGDTAEAGDPKAQQALDALWQGYGGGLVGFQRALGRQLEWAGKCCAEAIPSEAGGGVDYFATFDPLTVYPDRDDDGETIWRSIGDGPNDDPLDPDTCFIASVDGDDDNPDGEPIFSAFLAEGLKDIGQEQNLSDILRGWAYPHVSIGFPFEEAIRLALENPELVRGQAEDGGDITPAQFAETQFRAFVALLADLNPDDPIVGPKGTEAKVLDSGSGLAALDPLLKMRRHRMVMALDQLPNMLGITDGGTQAYAKDQTRNQSKKLEHLRSIPNSVAVSVSNLHLRLLGMNALVRAETEPIMPADRVADAAANEREVNTTMKMVDRGWLSEDDGATKHTGSKAVGPPKQTQQPAPAQDPNPQKQEPGNEN